MLADYASAKLDLNIDQGDTYYQEFTLTQANGTPLNLTDLSLNGSIKAYRGVSTTTASFTVTKIDAVNGIIALSLPILTTANLKKSMYVYVVYGVDGVSSSTINLLSGNVYVDNF